MKELVLEAWSNRELLKENKYADNIRALIEEIDKGRLRVAEPGEKGWVVNEWVKQAILLYFGIQPMQTWTIEPFEFYDKMLLKKKLQRPWCSCCSACCGQVWRLYSKERCTDAQLCKHWCLCR